MFTPLTALMLINAAAISVSNLEYIGAPKPTGIPVALNSIIAPQEDPAFLTASKYSYQSFTDFLSGQKKGFFLISVSFQFDLSQDIKPN